MNMPNKRCVNLPKAGSSSKLSFIGKSDVNIDDTAKRSARLAKAMECINYNFFKRKNNNNNNKK